MNIILEPSTLSTLSLKELDIVNKIGRKNADYCIIEILINRNKDKECKYDDKKRKLTIGNKSVLIPKNDIILEKISELEKYHKLDGIAEYITIIEFNL